MTASYPPWPVRHAPSIPYDETMYYQHLMYQYQKLETASSFRLLKLEKIPDDKRSRHYYTLITTNFESAPIYETVSYVWGTTRRDVTISLRDGKLLNITQPLKEALTRIEEFCTTSYLWIDQICINQNDLQERGHQVKVMGRIYSSCSRVIIWLGLCHDEAISGLRLKRIRIMHSFIRRLSKSFRKPYDGTVEYPAELLGLSSPWFRRAWVYQELVLAPKNIFVVHSGVTGANLTFFLDEMDTSIRTWNGNKGRHKNTMSCTVAGRMRAHWAAQHIGTTSPHKPFEEILSVVAPYAKTTEELDVIYAFFGLNTDPSIELTPSYGVSLPTAMTATAQSIIEGTCCLDIFELIPRGQRYRPSEKPSWVPDFSVEQMCDTFDRACFDFASFLTKAGFVPTFNTFDLGFPELRVRAYILDVVYAELKYNHFQYTTWEDDMSEDNFYLLLKQYRDLWHRTAEEHDTSNPRVKSEHARLVYYGQDFAPCPDERTLFTTMSAESLLLPVEEPGKVGFVPPDIYAELRWKMRGRRLYMTSSGRIIKGPVMEQDDKIMLMYGASNPVVCSTDLSMASRAIPESDLSESACVGSVKGTCYFEGWMDPWSHGTYKKVEAKSGDPLILYLR